MDERARKIPDRIKRLRQEVPEGRHMQIKVPPGNSDDLLEAREQRLMAFTADGIERLSEPGAYAGPATILAVARSVDSPAARALVGLRPVLVAHRVIVRLVIA